VNRGLSFAIAALQALIIAATTIGLIIAPLTLAWFIEGDGSVDYMVAFRVAAYAFLLACGVPLQFNPGEILGIAFPAFAISALPLGITLLIALLTIRVGHRLSAASSLWPAWLGGAASFGAIGLSVSMFSVNDAVVVAEWAPAIAPAMFFGSLLFIASVWGKRFELFEGSNPPEAQERIWVRNAVLGIKAKLHWSIATVLSPATRVGLAVVAALVLVSSTMIALALGFGWIEVARLYEGMHVSILGGVMLTIGQLAVLPNLIVWGMSWIAGPGFAIGTGSSVTALGTQLGPMPAFPVFVAIPTGGFDRGIIFILIPVLVAFIGTVLVRRFTDEMRWEYATRFSASLAFAFTAATVSAIAGFFLAIFASGAFGPGRFQEVGINAAALALALFIEVLIPSFVAGLVTIKPYTDATQRRK
jgi:hypothetical protein